MATNTSSSALLPALDQALQLISLFDWQSPATTRLVETLNRLSDIISHARKVSDEEAKVLLKLLLSLALLLKIPRACIADEDDVMDVDETELRANFLRVSPELLHVISPLVEVVSRSNCIDTAVSSSLVLSFARFLQKDLCEGFVSQASIAPTTAITQHLLTEVDRKQILETILRKSFPQYFKPHPKVNAQTGRVLSRPSGGDRGMMDWYEESEEETGWRIEPGLSNVVFLAVSSLKPTEVEAWWHLIIPPTLAYLDDYSPKFKLSGLNILSALLDRVDGSLLRRTGVGHILKQSLSSCFSSLESPYTSRLLSRASSLSLKLTDIVSPPPPSPSSSTLRSPTSAEITQSAERFQALCQVLEECVLHAWEFKGGNRAIEETVALILPEILLQLGSGSIRYLQVLIPHLTQLIGFEPPSKAVTDLHLAAISALSTTIKVSRPRSSRWAGTVLISVAKCWTSLSESKEGISLHKHHPEEALALKHALATLTTITADCGNGETLAFIERLKNLDPLFSGLVSGIMPSASLQVE